MADRLIVKGAREHNLRSVDLDLPRDALIVFTGLSGSGKSSLAFDTIFAEGQRRYVESLSAYARQFLGQMDKPDVDFIEGLSPAVSIDQKSTNRNPRSTVGTITEVYDYLRLLYARAGTPHCPVCGERIARQTPQQIVDQVLAMDEGTRFQVLAPVVRTRKGEFVDLFDKLNAQGYSRVRVDGVVHPLTDPPKLKKQEKHDIEVVVDRLTVKASAKQRLTDSVETALNLADGIVVLEFPDHEHDRPPASSGSPRSWPAPTGTRWPSTTWSRGRSRSTRPTAPARSAAAWASAKRSTPTWWCRPGSHAGRGRGGAVVDGPHRGVLHPDDGRARRGAGIRRRHPVAQAAGQGAQGDSRGLRRAGARALPQPLRPHPLVLRRLRRRDGVPAAQAGPDRVRADEGTLRGLHARRAVPGV